MPGANALTEARSVLHGVPGLVTAHGVGEDPGGDHAMGWTDGKLLRLSSWFALTTDSGSLSPNA